MPRHDRFEGCQPASSAKVPLAAEIRAGLTSRPPTLPAKFLYDDQGSALFDRICRTPEYYPTRTEFALLEEVAPAIARACEATELVEIGAGAARKTHVLLDALGARHRPLRYVPFDVSATAIEESAARLVERYPLLSVRGLTGDFTRDLGQVPPRPGRLVAFLGGTLGNLDDDEAVQLLTQAAALCGDDGHLLVAADLVKERGQLHAAYNDAAGLTARFNLNALARLGREFEAKVDLDAFRHDALFSEEKSRIEMHARATRRTRVEVARLEVALELAEGESIRTEISRKFTLQALRRLLDRAGLEGVREDVAPVPYALLLARRRPGS